MMVKVGLFTPDALTLTAINSTLSNLSLNKGKVVKCDTVLPPPWGVIGWSSAK